MGDDENTSGGSSINFGQILGGLTSAAGLGLAASNQQTSNNVLQQALQTIGPTQLQGYTMSGPGGMSSGYNPNGGAQISLGSLSPAFSSLVGNGVAGAGAYSSPLLSNLTNVSNGTLNPALSNLTSAYSGNNTYQNAAALQAAGLNNTYNSVYGNTLSGLQAIQQPQVQQQAFGLQNTLFGNGTLNSSGAASGALAAGNFGSQVNAMNAQDALSAQQQALSAMQGQAGIASSLSGTGNALLSNAFSNFGNTNQLISGLNTAQLNNSLSSLQGAGALNTLGLNNYLAALQTGSAQATATNQALFPYANVALGLSGTPNGSNVLMQALTGAGSSLLGGSGTGITGAVSGLSNLFSGLFGGSSNSALSGLTGLSGSDLGSLSYGMTSGSPLSTAGFATPSLGMPSYDTGTQYYGDPSAGFSAAGGEAANGSGLDDLSGSLNDISNSATLPSDMGISSAASPAIGLGTLGSAFGAVGGLTSGNPVGIASGALNAAQLGAGLGVTPAIAGTAGGYGLGALGIYSGLQQGGVMGDTQAAVGAAQTASAAANAGLLGSGGAASSLGALGSVALPAGIFAALYGFSMGQMADNPADYISNAQQNLAAAQNNQAAASATPTGVYAPAAGAGISSSSAWGQTASADQQLLNLLQQAYTQGNPYALAQVLNPIYVAGGANPGSYGMARPSQA